MALPCKLTPCTLTTFLAWSIPAVVAFMTDSPPLSIDRYRARQSGMADADKSVHCIRCAEVRAPFPFIDHTTIRSRPAPILSEATGFNTLTGHGTPALITSADTPPWPHAPLITAFAATGLPAPARLGFKHLALDNRRIRGACGQQALAGARAVRAAIKRVLDV